MSEEELVRRLEALEGQVARIGELEAEVARLREDAASARSLAAMADRDVAEMRNTMRGHTQVLNAIRATQLEQGRTLGEMAGAIGGLVTGTAQLAQGQETLTERVGGLTDTVTDIARVLDRHGQILDRLDPGEPPRD